MNKCVFVGGSNTTGTMYVAFWVAFLWPEATEIADAVFDLKGWGGIGSFHSLVHIQDRIIDGAPDLLFIEYAVNDSTDSSKTSRTNGWAAAAEALIRKVRTALPNCRIVVPNLVQDEQFYTPGSDQENSRAKWLNLCAKYDIPTMRFDTWLHGVLGTDTPAMEDLELYSDGVHFTELGHHTIANMVADRIAEWMPHVTPGWTGDLNDYDPPLYDDLEDWMGTPDLVNGADMTTGGTGWAVVETTAIQSSTVNDYLEYVGTVTAFGIYCSNNNAVIAWSVDGGAETNVTLNNSVLQLYSMDRDAHTIRLRVVSGTVKIYEFWAL